MQAKLRQSNQQLSIDETVHPATSRILLLAGLIIIVCAAVAAVHWPALSAKALLFDDQQYLHVNHLMQNPGWNSAKRFLTEVFEPSTVRGYYQPLTMISLMLDYAMGGRPEDLMVFHITNLSLHVVNTALVIVFLYMLFGNIWPAAIVGLLFGVHPLTVESIPAVAERKTLLAAFFALWCMVLYVRYARRGRWMSYIGCVLMYVFALLSKPTTVPVPILLLLLDFWPLHRLSWRVLAEKLPMFALAAVFAAITIISQGRTADIAMPAKYEPVRIALVLCHNIIFYLYKIVWPVNLSAHYPVPKPLAVSNQMVLAGVIGTCILIPVLLVSLRRTRGLFTGWLFFFIAILPTMGIIGFTYTIVADKYAYFPSVGLLIILAWLLAEFWPRLAGTWIRSIMLTILVLVLAVSQSFTTRSYLAHWQDTESLVRYMFTLSPDSVWLHNYWGVILSRQDRNKEAIEQFRQSLRIDPDDKRAHNNLGAVLAKQGHLDTAIRHFIKAVELNPANDNAHVNLAQALFFRGKTTGAIEHYRQSLRLRPKSPYALKGLAWLLATHKKEQFRNGPEALELAKQACQLTDYKNAEMLDALAAAYAEIGDFAQAVSIAQTAVDIALAGGQKNQARIIADRLQLYKAKKPYRMDYKFK